MHLQRVGAILVIACNGDSVTMIAVAASHIQRVGAILVIAFNGGNDGDGNAGFSVLGSRFW
jgi:hypothetical protein